MFQLITNISEVVGHSDTMIFLLELQHPFDLFVQVANLHTIEYIMLVACLDLGEAVMETGFLGFHLFLVLHLALLVFVDELGHLPEEVVSSLERA